jgi:hypothetical protein
MDAKVGQIQCNFLRLLSVALLFAFGRQQSCLPKALTALFDNPPTHPPDFIENAFYDTFDDQ